MKIARLGTAFLFAIGSYALSASGVAAAPMPNYVASDPTQAGAEAGTVPAPRWRAGSSWEYSDGYGLRVRDIKEGITTFERLDAPGQWFSMRGFLRQDAASSGAERQTIYRTVAPGFGESLSSSGPLTFQREYLSNGKLVVHASSWSVEGRQRITVPAGTFDCWIIVWRERSLKSNWTGFERWWYSPEAQQYVRMEYKYGTMEPASRVLMRYRLAPPVTADAPRPVPLPAASEHHLTPMRAAPIDAVKLDPLPPTPTPESPVHAPDPMLVPLSRKEPDPPELKEVPTGITRMTPMFIAPVPEVALETPSHPPLRAVAMISPVLGSIEALPMAEVAIEMEAPPVESEPLVALDSFEAQPSPLELEMPTIVMDNIETAPMVEVAIDLPEETADELAMLWPTDRIDYLKARVMPYYDPDPFMPAPAIAPEPAVGSEPFGFLGRIFRAIVRIFE